MSDYRGPVKIGQVYGYLTVIEVLDHNKERRARNILVECSCENKRFVMLSYRLTSGNTTSCGCQSHPKGNLAYKWCGYEEIPGAFLAELKANCKRRKLKLCIDLKDIWEAYLKQDRKCALSGLPINFSCKEGESTASIDRLNNDLCYLPDNFQLVHKDINFLRGTMTKEELIFWCRKALRNK